MWRERSMAWVSIMDHENRIYCKSSVWTLMLTKTISLNPLCGCFFLRMKDYGCWKCIVTAVWSAERSRYVKPCWLLKSSVVVAVVAFGPSEANCEHKLSQQFEEKSHLKINFSQSRYLQTNKKKKRTISLRLGARNSYWLLSCWFH